MGGHYRTIILEEMRRQNVEIIPPPAEEGPVNEMVCFVGAVDPCDVGSVMAIHRLVPVYSEVQSFLTRRAELWASTR